MNRKRLGITLIIVGIAGAAILALLGGMSESRSVASFGRANVGCRTWFQFDKPGTYYIFVESGSLRVIDQGCPPSASSEDLVLSLYADSRPVPLVPDASVGYSHDGATAVSTSRFELETSGRFELVAVGPNVEQVVALGADPATARRPWWFGAGMLLSVGVLGGLVLLFWGRSKQSAAEPAPADEVAKPAPRPRLPMSARTRGAATDGDRSAVPQGGSTGEIPTVGAGVSANAQPIPPIVTVSDTPTGQNRPRSRPVVSSGSTAGATGQNGGAKRGPRSRRRQPDDWDFDDDEPTATVGDAFDADAGLVVSGRPGPRKTSRRAPRVDEFVDDGWDDDDSGDLWLDEYDDDDLDDDDLDDDRGDDANGGAASRRRVVADAFDEADDVAPRRGRGRSRRRPSRYEYEPEFVGGHIDGGYDDLERVDDYLDEDAEFVDDYLDDDDEFVDDAEFVDDYLDDDGRDGYRGGSPVSYMEPPTPRRRRPPRGTRQRGGGQRPQPRERQVAPARRRRRRPSETQESTDRSEGSRVGSNAGRSLPEQRRTQPRRRRTPTPPPPPTDEWEELPPPTKARPPAAPSEPTGDAVVSDEWVTDGDDTGAWRWWSPPDPNDRAER